MQVARELRGMGVKCRLVGLSGNAMESDREEFMHAGVDQFHTKPISRDVLLSLMQGLPPSPGLLNLSFQQCQPLDHHHHESYTSALFSRDRSTFQAFT
ncbi:hypothetical protein AMTR_s00163p00022720 [Amborella trichopoda]|uniref:Response regulatory domain-containing protein n=1 Tax=Amborella trichopoda TaxID=13333 RepID=W1PLW3_AMBTC|nr:hypothetical protein AMTR_s00163p00022720 [Amborella trichopoda]